MTCECIKNDHPRRQESYREPTGITPPKRDSKNNQKGQKRNPVYEFNQFTIYMRWNIRQIQLGETPYPRCREDTAHPQMAKWLGTYHLQAALSEIGFQNDIEIIDPSRRVHALQSDTLSDKLPVETDGILRTSCLRRL
jgi:hypothetical protein